MKKKNFTRLAVCFLAMIVLVLPFMSCAGNDGTSMTDVSDNSGDNSDPSGTTTNVSDTTTISDDTGKDVLEGVIFNKEKLNILCWQASNVNEYVKQSDANTTIVDQAVYRRLLLTENQLNIETQWNVIPGNSSAPEFVDTAVAANSAGGEYDSIICYSSFAATLAIKGVLTDLNKFEYMDFTSPWYPQKLVEDCTMFDKLYFCTGDISTNLIFMTSLIFFNKGLFDIYQTNSKITEKYGEKDIYALVTSGKWTFEALSELCQGVYTDLDGSKTKTDADLYGISTYNTLLDNFYYGCGMKTIEVGENGLVLSQDFLDSDKIGSILTLAVDMLYTEESGYFFNGFDPTRKAFSGGRSLFSLAPASHAYTEHYKAEGLNYGVLPIPKYNTEQESYISVHSFPYSMCAIASQSKNQNISAAFLQCLGQNSYDTTKVAIFEQTMKLRYSENSDDSVMWDYIGASQTFDMGRVFTTQFDNKTSDLFRARITNKNTDWSSIAQKYGETLEANAEDVNFIIKKLP